MTLSRFAAAASLLLAFMAHGGPAIAADTDQPEAEKRNLTKWESGFDLKLGSVWNESTPQFSAQWVRRYLTGTHLGVTLSALPSSVSQREADGSKSRMNFLYGGLVVEQVLWEDFPYRVSASISAGQGRVYLRNSIAGRDDILEQPDFYFVEGGVNAYFYNYMHMDLGVVAGFRSVQMEDDAGVEDADVGGVFFGLSFRHTI